MEIWHEKLLALLIIFALILIPSIIPVRIPVKFAASDKGLLLLSITACFGGGVFFGAYLLHMAPEVDYLLREVWMKENGLTFPYPQFFVGIGFFMLLAVEQTMYLLGGAVQSAPEENKTTPKAKKIKANEPIIALSFEKTPREPIGVLFCPDGFANDESAAKGESAEQTPRIADIAVIEMDDANGIDDADFVTDSGEDRNGKDLNTEEDETKSNNAFNSESHGVRKTLMLMGALSSDCIFEGLSLGLQETKAGIWNLVIAILSHEIVIAFLLSLELLRHYRPRAVFWMAMFYSITCPAGILAGIAIMVAMGQHQSFPLISGIMQALCCGVFIYVTFFEILSRQFTGTHMTWKASAILIGFMIMAILAAIPTNHHGEDMADHANRTYSEWVMYMMTP